MSSPSASAQRPTWRSSPAKEPAIRRPHPIAVPIAEPHRVRPQRRVLAVGDVHQHDLPVADDGVGAGEEEPVVAEGAGHAECDDEQPCHRREERDPHLALLGVDDAREPGVAGPRPPHQPEDQQALGDALPGRVVGHQRRALGEREDEDEVEEELERRDPVLAAEDGGDPAGARRSGGLHHANPRKSRGAARSVRRRRAGPGRLPPRAPATPLRAGPRPPRAGSPVVGLGLRLAQRRRPSRRGGAGRSSGRRSRAG